MGVIYCITNEITGKYYIGQTIQNPRKRFNDHMTMQPEKSGARSLASSIRKHGRENFTMDILAKCLDRDELDRLEALWILITSANRCGVGYNRAYGGRTPHHGPETRKRLSESHKGKTQSEETRKKRSQKRLGFIWSDEMKRRLSEIAKSSGRKPSKDAIAKSIESRKGKPAWNKGIKGQVAWNKGIPMSDEQKEKLRTANIGRKHTPEWKANMSARLIGNKQCVGRVPWNKGNKKHPNKEATP